MTGAALGMPVKVLDQRPATPETDGYTDSICHRSASLSRIQCAVASTIISGMDGDFYTTLRWRLLRGFMLWFYGRRCMRCGSTYRVEIDHIVARARGEFGREYQWMPRNLQVLCREHNQEKMTKFDDWRPLWARVLMPVRDTPAVHRAETLAALSPDEYRRSYATTPLRVVQVGCLYPLSPYPGNTQRSCVRNNPEPVDQSKHWPSRRTMGRLATLMWDVGVVLTGVSIFLLIARIVGHRLGFKWRW
jgi:5-methylcytosine-specific restriction endonuclease McrA